MTNQGYKQVDQNHLRLNGMALRGYFSQVDDEVFINFCDIEEVFGSGRYDCGDGKVDYMWAFVCEETGHLFTVYNYRASIGYAPYDWHIGGHGETDWRAFTRWLINKIKEHHDI